MYPYKAESIHILVVDDEEPLRDILQRIITEKGYECTTAACTEEALDILKKKKVDIVITDINMPGASGIELLVSVKKKYDADVMVMTGFVKDYRYDEIIKKGASDFIQKPLSPKEVIPRLKRVLWERALIDERNRAREALIHRVKLERIVAEICTKFITVSSETIDHEISEALHVVGSFSGIDRSYVFLFSDDKMTMDNTHEWCAEGIELQIENLHNLPVDTFPWWMENLCKSGTIYIPRVADLPPEASAEKKILESQDIQSLLVVPMGYGDSLLGFLGFDMVRSEKTWLEEDTDLLEMLGEIFTNALKRQEAEYMLRESENRYRTIFETTGTATVIIDEDTTLILVNKQFEKLSGLPKGKIEGEKSFIEFVHNDDREMCRRYHESRRKEGKKAPQNYEFRMITGKGEIRDILVTVQMIPESQMSVASLLDITEKKLLEKRKNILHGLRECVWNMTRPEDIEKVFSSIRKGLLDLKIPFDNCGINTIETESDFIEIYSLNFINQNLVKMKLGTGACDLILSFCKNGTTVYRKNILENDTYNEKPTMERIFDGTIRSVIDVPFSYGTLTLNSSEPEAFSETDVKNLEEIAQILSEGFIRVEDLRQIKKHANELEKEIIEHKWAEEELRISEEKLRMIFNASPEAITVLDLDGKILDCNTAILGMHGYSSRDELIGKSAFILASPGDHQRAISSFEKLLREDFIKNAEYNLLTKDGREFLGEISAGVIYNSIGIPQSIVVISKDITERKKIRRRANSS